MSSPQLTIRSIPSKLDRILREKAAREGKSLNTVVLESLHQGLGLGDERPVHDDLDTFFGRWEEDEKFEAAIKEFNLIDEETWR